MSRKEPMRPRAGGLRHPAAPVVEVPVGIAFPESTEAVVPPIGPSGNGAAASGPNYVPKRTGYSKNVEITDNYKPPTSGKSLRDQQMG